MTILVLGGAGYVGSHAVYQLVELGYRVAVLDNLQTGHRAAVHPEAAFYEGDIRDRERLATIFEKEKITSVFHFAACSLVGESMYKPLMYYDNNVYGTQVLLEMMQRYDVKQIIFSSTAATYGDPEQIPIPETAKSRPTNPYGETKLAMEKMMKWADRAYGIKYVALRYFNVAGARESGELGEHHQPETHLIPIVLQVALGRRDYVTIFGDDYDTPDGTCIRDYIHVEDLIDAHILAMQYLRNSGESTIFNLGNSRGFSVKEIVEAARGVTGHPIPVLFANRRPGDPAKLVASAQKAREVLGWTPTRTSIRKIIGDAWNWHRHHPEGYKPRVQNDTTGIFN